MAKNNPFFLEGKNNQGVLLCHTLAGDPSQMLELGKMLNKNGYTVSCPLYKGHGGSYEDIIIDGNLVKLGHPEVKVDLGSIAKGYIVDRLVVFLKAQGMI